MFVAAGKMTSVQPQSQGPPPDYQGGFQGQHGHQPTHHQNTIVIANQPAAQQFKVKREWKTDKCACFDDMTICLGATFCPPCFGCHLAMEAEESCCLACWCQGWMAPVRSYVRGKLGIQGSVCKDILAVACCNLCVRCQLAREIKMQKNPVNGILHKP